ncbi:MAG: glycosyltransferase [Candidatus Aminicenantes bacterium]|nr:glycosyltransferase [Candidatus Aminicenantes bacterium]NIM79344.1 glycosyltransferase [Candidatus Aminicenantes bacterium]NIN18621.1 glycosyltransferase [Candidatus Aminicenantes bacterium]NIN42510.1 glycosyltransferase [Candidatus Aminicenantes bacterium]NIN85276.1 glycosyltransferase [Candidatus Aminicenantes bacterium]
MAQIESSLTPKTGLLVFNKKKFFSWDTWEPFIKFFVVGLGIGIIIFAIDRQVLFNWDFGRMLKMRSPFFRYLFIINGIIFIFALAFRTFLWFRYRPYDSGKVEAWPEVTVLVPAYNEGETVYKTICSVARSDYPEGQLKIIAIDDGSRDNTYAYMCKAREEFPEMVELIRFESNKGKRQGIYQGFKKSTSPFIVTVDSDTRLEPTALRELLTPLILDPKLGAVTGRIRIWNTDANILTKMLKANFAMAFDFTRAIQSTFSTVFCTSGAFSAYRCSVLSRFIDHWLKQTFLKCKCTFGEDRSLANHILRTGYGTAYQRTAVAFTMVPEKLTNILKMMTRWGRSNIRESIIFSGLMFNQNRKGNYTLPFIEFFLTTIVMFFHILLFYYFLLSGIVDASFLLRTLSYTVMFGFFYMLYYIRIEGPKDFSYILVFSFFSTIFMVGIYTVAGVTMTTRRWSTR